MGRGKTRGNMLARERFTTYFAGTYFGNVWYAKDFMFYFISSKIYCAKARLTTQDGFVCLPYFLPEGKSQRLD